MVEIFHLADVLHAEIVDICRRNMVEYDFLYRRIRKPVSGKLHLGHCLWIYRCRATSFRIKYMHGLSHKGTILIKACQTLVFNHIRLYDIVIVLTRLVFHVAGHYPVSHRIHDQRRRI